MDGPTDYHIMQSKSEKDKCHIIRYVESKKMNLFTKQKWSHRYRKHGNQGGWEGGINGEIRIDIYRQLYIK